MWTGRFMRLACTAMLFGQVQCYAQLRPQPPCGNQTVPTYPGLDNSPVVKFWSESDPATTGARPRAPVGVRRALPS